MPDLRLHFLGAPRFERLETTVNFERRKSIALLSFLCLNDQPLTRDTLATLLWPEYDQRSSRTTLRQVLTDIRQKLGGEFLELGREDVCRNPNHRTWVDVLEFREALRLTRTHGHSHHQVCDRCIELLAKAINLYRGDFLTGFTVADSIDFDDWQSFQTEHFRLELVDSFDRIIRYYVEHDLFDAGVVYARQWLSLNPLDERPHRYLMRLYDATGHKAAAANQFNACKHVIEATGLTLDAETLDLYRQIREKPGVSVEKPVTPPAAAPVPKALPKSSLPALPTSFVGRDTELNNIRDYLTEPGCRLLTILGAPGVGKTRLSIEAASELLPAFADGAHFVALTSLQDASLLPYTINRLLGLQERGEANELDLLKGYLASKSCLLVLDNFEHLLSAAPVVGELLSAAPHLKILVTSREALEIYGEYEYLVPPLLLPGLDEQGDQIMQNEAVRLFAQRAQAAVSDFRLTPDNALVVAQICTRLDGLPLAIEFAATRIKLYSPDRLLELLDQRLSTLTSTIRDLPARHQTLRAAIEWSYSLLDQAEAALFRRLGAFIGGWSLDSAAAVCASGLSGVPDLLDSLLHKHLIQPMKGEHAQLRFEMLETIREYGLEKLVESGEEPGIRDVVATFFLRFAEQAVSELRGSQQRVWAQRLGDDYDNLRSIMRWLLEKGDIETLQQLGSYLTVFWHDRGYLAEGRYWLETALSGQNATLSVRKAETVEALFSLAWAQGDYVAAERYATQYLNLAYLLGDDQIIGGALYSLGGVAIAVGDYNRARGYYAESRRYTSDPKKPWSTSFALTGIGEAAYLQGDYPAARLYYAQDLQRAREAGSPQAISAALNGLAKVTDMEGDYESAQMYARESLQLAEDVGNRQGIAIALNRLGSIARQLGNYAQSKSLHEKSLSLAYAINNAPITAFTLNKLGETAMDMGDYMAAIKLFTDALKLNRDMNDPYYVAENLCYLAAICVKQGRLNEARAHMSEALELASQINALVIVLQVFVCFSQCYVMRRMFDQAAALLGFLMQHPALPAYSRRIILSLYHDLETILPPEKLRASFEYGQTLPIEAVIEKLVQEKAD